MKCLAGGRFRYVTGTDETLLLQKPVSQVRILPGAPRRWVFLGEPGYIRAITGAGVVFALDEFPAYGGVVGRTDELLWVMSRRGSDGIVPLMVGVKQGGTDC